MATKTKAAPKKPAPKTSASKTSAPKKAAPTGSAPLLTLRELNRATLARQMLLARDERTPIAAVEQLVALQAQAARPPFVALWTRLAKFTRQDLAALVNNAHVVRATSLRATLHITSARDYRAFWPALRPMLAGAVKGLGARAKDIDVDDLAVLARKLLAKGPARFDDIRAHLKAARPKLDERAMGYAVRTGLPLVHVPGGDAWSFAPDAAVELADQKLGALADAEGDAVAALLLRYLAAFGPASVADAQTWSGLKKLGPAFEALRPQLAVFRDEDGRELFDVADAPRPGADIDAPVRFIPDFDNLVLAHADRRRIIADEHRPHLVTKNLLVRATFLVDGAVAGLWSTTRKGKTATLTLAPFGSIAKKTRATLEEEAQALLRFVEPEAATHDLVMQTP